MAKKRTNRTAQRKKAAFLAAFRECGNISRAARESDVPRTMHYLWMEDEEYVAAFRQAEEEAADHLEEEARRRAVDGLRRLKFFKGAPIIDPDTQEPYYELEYSDTLLIFLLKGVRPDKFRDRHEITGKDGKALIPLEELRRLMEEAEQKAGVQDVNPFAGGSDDDG